MGTKWRISGCGAVGGIHHRPLPRVGRPDQPTRPPRAARRVFPHGAMRTSRRRLAPAQTQGPARALLVATSARLRIADGSARSVLGANCRPDGCKHRSGHDEVGRVGERRLAPRGLADWCRFPPAPHRSVHAVLPHTAHRRSSPSAFGSLTPGPVRPGRGDGSVQADQSIAVRSGVECSSPVAPRLLIAGCDPQL